VRNFHGASLRFLVEHPTQGLRTRLAARWADPKPYVAQRSTDLANASTGVAFFLSMMQLVSVNLRDRQRVFSGKPHAPSSIVVVDGNPQSVQDL